MSYFLFFLYFSQSCLTISQRRFLSQVFKLTIFYLFWLALIISACHLVIGSCPAISVYLLSLQINQTAISNVNNTFKKSLSIYSSVNTLNTPLSSSYPRLKVANSPRSSDYFSENRLKPQLVLKTSSSFLHSIDSLMESLPSNLPQACESFQSNRHSMISRIFHI